ncbi:MAG: hypothetical protein M4D80_34170 [Myxococcota bacterium]|nr:hypothetical protein [Myxococcota bacterium]
MADYLGPKPGEKLEKKEVSAKTMGRLQVAADAIAETKKAIPKQGNQVQALSSSKMNSKYRLEVMRNDSMWEYTNETSRRLADENFEAQLAAKADIAHGGNCGEHGFLAYHYLRQHAKGEKIAVSSSGELDHQFAVIGDQAKESPSEMVVSDPWVMKPTACLWEDHFAYGPDLNVDYGGGVADGKSFKAAIASGLKLNARGQAYLQKAETEEKTKAMIEADDHVWSNDDAAAEGKKFDYQTKKPAAAATGAGARAEHE